VPELWREDVNKEDADVVAEVRRVDSLRVVVCAGAGFLFELFDVEVVVGVDFMAIVDSSAESSGLRTSPLARFIIRKSDFDVSLSQERPKSATNVVQTL